MATNRKDLRQRVLEIKELYFDVKSNGKETEFDKMLEQALNMADLEKLEDNYKPAYSIFAAILERFAEICINGSCFIDERKKGKKLKDKIKKNLWLS